MPSNKRSKADWRGRRLRERLLDRLRGALVRATVREDFLLPVDRGLARWDEPDLLRGRDGEDARVAMLVRVQDQWRCGLVTRRGPRLSCRTVGQHGLEIGLDASSTTRVRPGNAEHVRGGQTHRRASEGRGPSALRASVARAAPRDMKWSKPVSDSHVAPSTKTSA